MSSDGIFRACSWGLEYQVLVTFTKARGEGTVPPRHTTRKFHFVFSMAYVSHGGRNPRKRPVFPYPLYRTRIAGLKGTPRSRLPSPAARPSIAPHTGAQRQWQGGTGPSPPRNSQNFSDRPTCACSDCTTYLDPAPGPAPSPTSPARHATFEDGHIPGADFLDLQGEFSDTGTPSLHDAPRRPARGRVRPPRLSGATAPRVLYTIGTMMWATRFWWMLPRSASTPACSTAASTNGRPKGRPLETGAPRGYPPATFAAAPRRASCRQPTDPPPPPNPAPSSSTRWGRSSMGWSPAATAAPAACPAAATCRRPPCSIPRPRRFPPLADAEAKFAAQGVTKDKRAVAYCGGGISATIDLFLLHRLGHDNLTLYDGLDGRVGQGGTSLPIETG